MIVTLHVIKKLWNAGLDNIIHHQRNSGQELIKSMIVGAGADAEMPWRGVSGLLHLACSACFLIEFRTSSTRMVSATIDSYFPFIIN